MNTLARLEELKRNLAQLERKRTPPKAAGGSDGRGREADHPGETRLDGHHVALVGRDF
jgi:hypothetical protein